jgi:hypothetical protein
MTCVHACVHVYLQSWYTLTYNLAVLNYRIFLICILSMGVTTRDVLNTHISYCIKIL